MKFVANIRAKMKRSLNCYDDLFWLQTRIENVARDLGANSFQVKGFSIDDSSKMVSLTLMTYLSPDSLLKHTEEMPHNSMLYVFPSTARYTNKPFILHVNDKKVSLGYREYFAYHISPGEIIGIRKGIAAERIVGYPGSPAIALAHAKFAVLNNESGQFNEMPLSNMKLLLETYFKYPKTIDFRH